MSKGSFITAIGGFLIFVVFVLAAFAWYLSNVASQHAAEQHLTPTQALQTAGSAFDQNDFSIAMQSVNSVLAQNQNDETALIAKARILAQEASLQHKERELGDQALVYVDQALAINSQNVDALTLKGYIYEIQQQYDKADALYQQALTINPNFAYALAQYGHSLQLQGKNDAARPFYERALAVDPTNPIAASGLAKILAYAGAYDEATALYMRVATSSTNARLRAESYYSAALIAEAQGADHLNEETSYARAAVAADPSYPQSYVVLSRLALAAATAATSTSQREGNLNTSFFALDQALNLNPGLAIANLQLATNLYALQRYTDAANVAGELPKIIADDISLSATEKVAMQNAARNLTDEIQKSL